MHVYTHIKMVYNWKGDLIIKILIKNDAILNVIIIKEEFLLYVKYNLNIILKINLIY